MNPSYFDLTVPIFKKNLLIARTLLERGLTHATETGLSEADFLGLRLAPDMFPLMRQIQILTDNAKGAAARLAGVETPKIADEETTVTELLSRIDTVLAFLDTLEPSRFSDAAEKSIMLPFIPDQYQNGADFLVDFALPNFFFHMSILYAILRVQGVPVGKMDFIGSLKLHPIE